jgi:exopolysaccharide production protein ExoZ
VQLLSVQYLRGVAALLVVLFHIFVQLNRLGYHGASPLFLSAGVDIFFVISGFIMWYTTFNRNVGPLEFLRHRFVRIVPLYWLVTTFYVVVLIVKPGLLQSAKFQLSHIAASYLFIPVPHPIFAREMWPLVVPGWTLNCEMFFYLLFALALLFVGRVRAGIVVAILLFMVSLQIFSPPNNSIIGFYSSSIMLEFALGVAIGYLYTSGVSFRAVPAGLMLLAGILGLTLIENVGLATLPRILIFGVPACLIVASAVFYERNYRIAELAFPKLIGDASYSLYLSHGAVLSAFERIWWISGAPRMSGIVLPILFSVIGVLLAIIGSIGLYRFVERPLLLKLSTRSKRKAFKSDQQVIYD